MLVGKDLYTFQYKQRYCLITVRLFHLNTAMEIMKNTNKATMVSLDINDIMQPFLHELKLFLGLLSGKPSSPVRETWKRSLGLFIGVGMGWGGGVHT